MTRAELARAHQRIHELEALAEALRVQLREALNLAELQKADIDRYRKAYEQAQPNRPERVPPNELQLAFERVVETFVSAPANDAEKAKTTEGETPTETDAPLETGTSVEGTTQADRATSTEPRSGETAGGTTSTETPPGAPSKEKKPKRRHQHGRRRLDLAKLPVQVIEIDPDEVKATQSVGFASIGEETSERIAFRPGRFIRLRVVRRRWIRLETGTRGIEVAQKVAPVETNATTLSPPMVEEATVTPQVVAQVEANATTVLPPAVEDEAAEPASPVLVAPLPLSLWPQFMADPSAIASVIVTKYEDIQPLHRQERTSVRHGFVLPRSTQCGWLGAADEVCYRIVDAMFDEARTKAFCIATDATGAPVRAPGKCAHWHMFVFIADHDHVVFRYTAEHTGDAVTSMLRGFHGYLLSDAAPIYDVLYREHGILEVACWFHARRYFWRALESDRPRALEALAIISALFKVERECRDIPMPARTVARAARAKPVLELFDQWIDRHRDHVDPRGPLDAAIGYYDNQREALRRFLDDGRLRLDNNISEGALRYLVLGRRNWTFFANETGLRWYATFRSLIASCALHGLNPEEYLEQVLRLAPHWPVTRVLELAPKYWAQTVARLDDSQRAILVRPWELTDTAVAIVDAVDAAA